MAPDSDTPSGPSPEDELAAQAEQAEPGLVREFWDFLRYSKSWWLTPIIVVLLLIALFAVLTGTGAAPFIYTLF